MHNSKEATSSVEGQKQNTDLKLLLHRYVTSNKFEMLKKLIKHLGSKAKIAELDSKEKNVLHLLAEHSKTQEAISLLQLIIKHCNAKEVEFASNARELEHYSTPLINAVSLGNTEMVRILLTINGIDVNMQNVLGQTALHCATQAGFTDIVSALLEVQELDLDKKDKQKQTAYVIAETKYWATSQSGEDETSYPYGEIMESISHKQNERSEKNTSNSGLLSSSSSSQSSSSNQENQEDNYNIAQSTVDMLYSLTNSVVNILGFK